MKTYTCSVCGKTYTDLDKYVECVKACSLKEKAIAAEKVKKEAEAKKLKTQYAEAIATAKSLLDQKIAKCKTALEDYNKICEEARDKVGIVRPMYSITLTKRTETSAEVDYNKLMEKLFEKAPKLDKEKVISTDEFDKFIKDDSIGKLVKDIFGF